MKTPVTNLLKGGKHNSRARNNLSIHKLSIHVSAIVHESNYRPGSHSFSGCHENSTFAVVLT